MKKATKKRILILIGIVSLGVCIVFLLRFLAFPPLDINRVKKVEILDYRFVAHTLSQEELERFLELYNSAAYGGTKPDAETTPDFAFRVYFTDHIWFTAEQFAYSSCKFKIYYHLPWEMQSVYFTSEPLYAFAGELLEKYATAQ